MHLIRVEELRVDRNGHCICAVPHLDVEQGERIAVHGRNGSGKTTLLRILAGLEDDYAGSCQVDVSHRERTYVDQRPYLFRGTVLANVMYGLEARGTKYSAARYQALHWLERFAMTDLAKADVERLSGGERRRIALARAAVTEPHLMLLDEPLADMDERGTECVRRLLADSEATILVTAPAGLPRGLCTREIELNPPAGRTPR